MERRPMDEKGRAASEREATPIEPKAKKVTAGSINEIASNLQAASSPQCRQCDSGDGHKPTKTERRYYCRNRPRCGCRLKVSTANPRDAFCTRSCWQQFYRHRCLVCEREMPRNAEHQKVCHRSK